MSTFVDEFRGTDKLVIAEILTDNNEIGEGYTTDSVEILAPVAEITKSVETATTTKYYDNAAALVIQAEGSDTITLSVPALSIATLGKITGKTVDATTGALMDGVAMPRYFALGYRLRLTDGTYRYVWRYKGRFAIPEEASATENADAESQGQTLTYTGIYTNHIFAKTGGLEKALVVDERDGKAELSTFFDTVTTCDTITAKNTTLYNVTNTLSNATNSNPAATAVSGSAYIGAISANQGYQISSVTVTMGGVDVSATAYSSDNDVIRIDNVTGDIVITVTTTAAA